MKNLSKDTKLLLFENMEKLNPDFKLTEADKKWIQNAVNPEHKGFCTPMTKSTCTPARKALAKRFKKGIDEELGLNNVDNSENLKFKADKLKLVIDDLLNNEDFDVLDTLYRLLIDRKKPIKSLQHVTEINAGVIQPTFNSDYKKKADLLKEKIEFLFDNDHYDIIDKLNNIITKLSPKKNKPETEIGEVKVQQNDTYFETLSAALDAVKERVAKKGYTVDEDEMFTQFGTGGINYLETKRATISLLRNGIPDKRRSVTIAIYRMDSGKYELTAYMN